MRDFFTHYPLRLLWAGASVQCLFAIIAGSLLLPFAGQPIYPLPPLQAAHEGVAEAIPTLSIAERSHRIWDWPAIEEGISISLSPARPSNGQYQPAAHVRLKGSEERSMALPCRVYLYFNDRGVLHFQEGEGSFWMDLSMEGSQLAARLQAQDQGVEIYHGQISHPVEEPPLQKGEEFPAGTPIRILGEGRSSGVDLVSQLGSSEVKQRVEIGASSLQIGENEWIAFKDGRWEKIKNPSDVPDFPVARFRAILPERIEWDVWDACLYARLACPIQASPIAHTKLEEWLTSLRVRSDRQISCAIEKQCLILHLGDWVLKENGRWRILRRAEDRQQLLKGNKSGELFVLEKIDSKQKSIKGKIFFANRTQTMPVEIIAQKAKLTRRMHGKGSSA